MPAEVTGAQGTAKNTMPQNIEAEQTVLAACLLSNGVFEEVSLTLKPEHFYRPAHRIIFETMRSMNAASVPIDIVSVADHLRANGQLEAVGGQVYLSELADNTFAFTSWQHHTEIVRRDALRRELLFASAEITSLAYDSPADPKELISQAEGRLFQVTEQTTSSTFKPIHDLIVEANDEIAEMDKRGEDIQGVPTGFVDVDKLFHGLRGGDLMILAARPGVGKTSFAMNLAANAAKLGSTVALFSLEMAANQLVQRLICAEANINLSLLRSPGSKDANFWAQVVEASSRLSNTEFFIDDSPSLSIVELRTKARRMMRDCEKGLIIVDYLQLMQPVIPHPNNRAVEVAEISRGLKVLAKELDVPVLALSQLSRSIESRTSKQPMLSDLRESGSIEQDADIVMFLDRSMNEEEASKADRPDEGMAKLIVAKHRNGPTRTIDLAFVQQSTKFIDFFDDSNYPQH